MLVPFVYHNKEVLQPHERDCKENLDIAPPTIQVDFIHVTVQRCIHHDQHLHEKVVVYLVINRKIVAEHVYSLQVHDVLIEKVSNCL